MILTMIVDAMMAFLLAITIFFCWKLNGRIKMLQDNKEELADTIREFDVCTKRAAQSIAEIHTATQRISENIQHKIDKASFIADDLEIMISRGNKIMGKPTDEKRPATGARKPVGGRESVATKAAAARKPRAAFVEKPDEAEPDGVEETQVQAPKMTENLPPRGRSRAEREMMDAVKGSEDEIV